MLSVANIAQLPNMSRGNNKSFKRAGNSYSLSPMHERYRIFKETYNASREDLKEYIRLSKDTVFNKVLYAYYNKFYTLELKNWGDKNPEFLPVLNLNNPDIAQLVGVEAKSTVYRALTFLTKVDLGEGRGRLLKKKTHGVKQDYTIFINPWILTGQVIENWGTSSEKKWQKIEKNEAKNQKPPLALSANCNLPFITGTIVNNKTTTSECGKADNFSSVQEQETGTKQESYVQVKNPYLKAYLMAQDNKNTQTGACGSNGSKSSHSEPINDVSKQTPSNIKEINPKQNPNIEANTGSKNVDKYADNTINTPQKVTVRQKSFELTYDFYDYAMPILYPKHRNSCKQQQKKILTTMWTCWFKPFAENQACTIDFLYKLLDELKEMVVMTQLELDKNPHSFVHANPAVFFDSSFQHGLARAAKKYRENKLNKDMAILRKAQKSLRKGIIPRGIKNIHSMIDLVAYWKNHIEKCTVNKALIMKSLNIFLTNPKNLAPNGLKL